MYFLGYGDIFPTTNNGRFFYMVFSVVGIPLVVSVLTACGSIIKAVNMRFFRFLNKCCFKEKPVVNFYSLSFKIVAFYFWNSQILPLWFFLSMHFVCMKNFNFFCFFFFQPMRVTNWLLFSKKNKWSIN